MGTVSRATGHMHAPSDTGPKRGREGYHDDVVYRRHPNSRDRKDIAVVEAGRYGTRSLPFSMEQLELANALPRPVLHAMGPDILEMIVSYLSPMYAVVDSQIDTNDASFFSLPYNLIGFSTHAGVRYYVLSNVDEPEELEVISVDKRDRRARIHFSGNFDAIAIDGGVFYGSWTYDTAAFGRSATAGSIHRWALPTALSMMADAEAAGVGGADTTVQIDQQLLGSEAVTTPEYNGSDFVLSAANAKTVLPDGFNYDLSSPAGSTNGQEGSSNMLVLNGEDVTSAVTDYIPTKTIADDSPGDVSAPPLRSHVPMILRTLRAAVPELRDALLSGFTYDQTRVRMHVSSDGRRVATRMWPKWKDMPADPAYSVLVLTDFADDGVVQTKYVNVPPSVFLVLGFIPGSYNILVAGKTHIGQMDAARNYTLRLSDVSHGGIYPGACVIGEQSFVYLRMAQLVAPTAQGTHSFRMIHQCYANTDVYEELHQWVQFKNPVPYMGGSVEPNESFALFLRNNEVRWFRTSATMLTLGRSATAITGPKRGHSDLKDTKSDDTTATAAAEAATSLMIKMNAAAANATASASDSTSQNWAKRIKLATGRKEKEDNKDVKSAPVSAVDIIASATPDTFLRDMLSVVASYSTPIYKIVPASAEVVARIRKMWSRDYSLITTSKDISVLRVFRPRALGGGHNDDCVVALNKDGQLLNTQLTFRRPVTSSDKAMTLQATAAGDGLMIDVYQRDFECAFRVIPIVNGVPDNKTSRDIHFDIEKETLESIAVTHGASYTDEKARYRMIVKHEDMMTFDEAHHAFISDDNKVFAVEIWLPYEIRDKLAKDRSHTPLSQSLLMVFPTPELGKEFAGGDCIHIGSARTLGFRANSHDIVLSDQKRIVILNSNSEYEQRTTGVELEDGLQAGSVVLGEHSMVYDVRRGPDTDFSDADSDTYWVELRQQSYTDADAKSVIAKVNVRDQDTVNLCGSLVPGGTFAMVRRSLDSPGPRFMFHQTTIFTVTNEILTLGKRCSSSAITGPKRPHESVEKDDETTQTTAAAFATTSASAATASSSNNTAASVDWIRRVKLATDRKEDDRKDIKTPLPTSAANIIAAASPDAFIPDTLSIVASYSTLIHKIVPASAVVVSRIRKLWDRRESVLNASPDLSALDICTADQNAANNAYVSALDKDGRVWKTQLPVDAIVDSKGSHMALQAAVLNHDFIIGLYQRQLEWAFQVTPMRDGVPDFKNIGVFRFNIDAATLDSIAATRNASYTDEKSRYRMIVRHTATEWSDAINHVFVSTDNKVCAAKIRISYEIHDTLEKAPLRDINARVYPSKTLLMVFPFPGLQKEWSGPTAVHIVGPGVMLGFRANSYDVILNDGRRIVILNSNRNYESSLGMWLIDSVGPENAVLGEHSMIYTVRRGLDTDFSDDDTEDRNEWVEIHHQSYTDDVREVVSKVHILENDSVRLHGSLVTGGTFAMLRGSIDVAGYKFMFHQTTIFTVTNEIRTLGLRNVSALTGTKRATDDWKESTLTLGKRCAPALTGNDRKDVPEDNANAVHVVPKLELVDADRKRPEVGSYTLVLQLQYPEVRRNAKRQVYTTDEKKNGGRWRIGIPKDTPSNAIALISLMMQRKTDEGLVCQYRLATCTVDMRRLCTAGETPLRLKLTNVENKEQGWLTLTITDASTVALGPACNQPVFKGSPYYPQSQINSGVVPSGTVAEFFRRTHVSYLNEMTPVWMICMIRDTDPLKAVPDSFLLNALEHTTRWCGYESPTQWAAATTTDWTHEVLAQVVGFFPWSRRYQYDKTYDRTKHHYELFEQFSCVREKASMKLAGGDCEDFSQDMKLVFDAIFRRDPTTYPKGSPLETLVRMAQCYFCFTVDSSISNNNRAMGNYPQQDTPSGWSDQPGVDLHMYIQLIPRVTVQAMLNNTGNEQKLDIGSGNSTPSMPILSLESTEPCIANWRIKTKGRNRFIKAIQAMKTYNNPKAPHHDEGERTPTRRAWAKLSVHTTKESFQKDQFYRLDICGYSSQLYEATGVTGLLFCNTNEFAQKARSFGVSKNEWMFFQDKVSPLGFAALWRATEDEKAKLAVLQSLAPARCNLSLDSPLPISKSSDGKDIAYATGPSETEGEIYRVFARQVDWTEADDRLICESAAADKFVVSGGTYKTVRVMNDVDMVMYQFQKKSAK